MACVESPSAPDPSVRLSSTGSGWWSGKCHSFCLRAVLLRNGRSARITKWHVANPGFAYCSYCCEKVVLPWLARRLERRLSLKVDLFCLRIVFAVSTAADLLLTNLHGYWSEQSSLIEEDDAGAKAQCVAAIHSPILFVTVAATAQSKKEMKAGVRDRCDRQNKSSRVFDLPHMTRV